MKKIFKEDLEKKKLKIVQGDGRQGYKDHAPYDVIHVGASGPSMFTVKVLSCMLASCDALKQNSYCVDLLT